MWFLARMYDAKEAKLMGLVNTVVPLDQLEEETLVWYVCPALPSFVCLKFTFFMFLFFMIRCREILRNSPTALRVLKAAMNAAEDGHEGIQVGLEGGWVEEAIK